MAEDKKETEREMVEIPRDLATTLFDNDLHSKARAICSSIGRSVEGVESSVRFYIKTRNKYRKYGHDTRDMDTSAANSVRDKYAYLAEEIENGS